MFGKLITIIASLAISTVALAEQQVLNKKVTCDDSSKMLPFFGEKYGEEPIWIGTTKTDDGKDVVYLGVVVNPETQTWSVVMYNKEVSCLIESGEGFKFTLPEGKK